MAFENLSDRLSQAMKKLSGQAQLTDKNMSEMLGEVRIALLEGDVSLDVVNHLIEAVQTKAKGMDVIKSVDPSQMVVKVVNDELVELLGEKEATLNLESHPSVILMVGLQGTGKTTSSAKIANYLKNKQDKKVLLVAADYSRPAAIQQLQVLGEQIGVDVHTADNVLDNVKESLEFAKKENYDVVIIDSAGRLHIDETLMDELKTIESLSAPDEILLTVDAMSGQDIIHVARGFNQALRVSGLVATKFDGDSRGGAILSVRYETGVPIKFVGTGEKIEQLELFYPDRIASRILGMGDILTLVEQAQEKMDMEAAEKAAERMMSGEFTLEDMLTQLEQVKKMGPLSGIMKMLPGMGNMKEMMKQVNDDQADASMKKTKAVIQSMTKQERKNPDLLRASRKNRIAKGAGVSTTDVGRVISQYEKTKKQMKLVSRMFGGMK